MCHFYLIWLFPPCVKANQPNGQLVCASVIQNLLTLILNFFSFEQPHLFHFYFSTPMTRCNYWFYFVHWFSKHLILTISQVWISTSYVKTQKCCASKSFPLKMCVKMHIESFRTSCSLRQILNSAQPNHQWWSETYHSNCIVRPCGWTDWIENKSFPKEN